MWQETAPGFQAPRQRPQVQVQQQQQSLNFDDEFENDDQESLSGNSGGGLVFPSGQVCFQSIQI